MVREAIRTVHPAVVLIEGPWDFNDRIHELHLDHTLPIAIYSYAAFADGTRRGAYYPLCIHSPEWQALATARAVGATVRFIDLPWAVRARSDRRTHLYADDRLRTSGYIRELCRALEVEDFDAAWDVLAEHDAALGPEEIRRRVGSYCTHLRRADGDAVSEYDLEREGFMAACLREACAEVGAERVVVVTGGYHSTTLTERLEAGMDRSPADLLVWPEDLSERGLALTPYSHQRLDSLTGYDAGMPSPGFYHRAWMHDEAGDPAPVHTPLLQAVAARLREMKQPVSTADLIAVEGCAAGLAALRGHARVWRRDLIDGAVSSLLKDESTAHHPFLLALQEVLRGSGRGRLAADSPMPPLVRDIEARLHTAGLTPGAVAADRSLDLAHPAQLEHSRLLHSLAVLELPGFVRTAGVDFSARTDLTSLRETWRISDHPDLTAAMIEASRWGSALPEAVAGYLEEKAGDVGRSSAKVAALLLDAVLAGALIPAEGLRARAVEVVRADGDLGSVAWALGHFLYLHAWDDTLGTRNSGETAMLLAEAWLRAVWLLESGSPAQSEREEVEAVRLIRDAALRIPDVQPRATEDLLPVLARIRGDPRHPPGHRGACAGALWSLGGAEAADIRTDLMSFNAPENLGEYLGGLFALAREEAQRDEPLLTAIHVVVQDWEDTDFLAALPSLRRAFMYFTPREKDFMARTLFGRESPEESAASAPAGLEVSVSAAAAAMALEARLFAEAARLGVRLTSSE
jgi:hypothetical protein